jgi:hypothetical protein
MGTPASAPAEENVSANMPNNGKRNGIRKKKPKFVERKMDSFMNRLARRVGTQTTSEVNAELDKMYRFMLNRLCDTALIIDTVYSKTDTVKPSLLHAAVQTIMIDGMRDAAMEAGATAVNKHVEDKKKAKGKQAEEAEEAEEAA